MTAPTNKKVRPIVKEIIKALGDPTQKNQNNKSDKGDSLTSSYSETGSYQITPNESLVEVLDFFKVGSIPVVSELHLKKMMSAIVEETLKAIEKSEQEASPLKWENISETAKRIIFEGPRPELRGYIAQYLVSYCNFAISTSGQLRFLDEPVDVATIRDSCEKLKAKLGFDGKITDPSEVNLRVFERLIRSFGRFYKGIKSWRRFKEDRGSHFKGGFEITHLIKHERLYRFINDWEWNRKGVDFLVTCADEIWEYIAHIYGLKDSLALEDKVRVELYFWNTKQFLRGVAKEIDAPEKKFSREFKLFIINCLLLRLFGCDALTFTDEDFEKAKSITTNEFLDVIFDKLGITNPNLCFKPLDEVRAEGFPKKQRRHSVVSTDEKTLTEKKDELAEAEKKLAAIREEIDKATKQRDNLKPTVEKLVELASDKDLSSKIMGVISHFMDTSNQLKEGDVDTKYKKRIDALRGVKTNSEEGDLLNASLCKQLSRFRNYPSNEYVNLLVCVAQNFLTVLSGLPGSGKTSLCNELARILGLTSFEEEKKIREQWAENPLYANRYVVISVEKGWTNKRDLIGYFNPLRRTFESTDPHRFECFRQLDYETKEGFLDLPYLMLLDEANLSSIEHYFADFMNICDERNKLSAISLGGNVRFSIPETLRFLATINNDNTTEMLSPRLIDRTWIIQLPDVEDTDNGSWIGQLTDREGTEKYGDSTSKVKPVNWNHFLRTYYPQIEDKEKLLKLKGILKEDLKGISMVFSSLGKSISPRTRKAICRYVYIAQKYMDGDVYRHQDADEDKSSYKATLNSVLPKDVVQKYIDGNVYRGKDKGEDESKYRVEKSKYLVALDYAVAQKLLPMIDCAGKDSKKKLEMIKTILHCCSLKKSERLLKAIIDRGDRAMNYYHFFQC